MVSFVLQGLALALGAIVIGGAISALWVVPVLLRRRRQGGLAKLRGLVWLSAPWLIMLPIGLAGAFINIPPAALALFTSYVAVGMVLSMPVVTLGVAIAGVILFKGRRWPAVAIGAGNVVIALLCSFSILPVYTLARGGV